MSEYTPVPPQVDLPQLEREVLAFWAENDTFAKSLARNGGAQPWTLGRATQTLLRTTRGTVGRFSAMTSWNWLPAAFNSSALAASCQALMASSTAGILARLQFGAGMVPEPTKRMTTSIGTGQR